MSITKNNHKARISTLSFLVVITPMLEPYAICGVSLDTILFYGIVLYSIIAFSKTLKFSLGEKPFFIYAIIVPNICAFAYGYVSHISSSLLVVITYWLCISKVIPQLTTDSVIRWYKSAVWISCIVFIIQEIMFALLGYRFSALFPFFDIKYSGLSMHSFISAQMTSERSSAFFLEPSHFAQYIVPYLAIILGNNKNPFEIKGYIQPFILTFVLLISRSGCGMIGAILIWLFYILNVKLPMSKKIIFILASIILIYVSFHYISATDLGQSLINRSSEFEDDKSYERSGMQRVVRGFLVYSAMPYLQQLLGVGTGGCINVIDNSIFQYMFIGSERYLNNIQTLLIGFGLIGTILFAVHIRKLSMDNYLSAKLLLAAFVGMSFLESFFMTSKMALYMAIIICYKNMYYKRNKSLLTSNEE